MKNIIIDHRMRSCDRRSWDTTPGYPFVDSDEVMVHEDRRFFAERRGFELNDIVIEEIAIEGPNRAVPGVYGHRVF